MSSDERILLILDLDETLVYATEDKLDREPDCTVGPYHVYGRPHLEAFLRACHQHFRLAVWSSSTADYAEAVVRTTFPPGIEPIFLWHRRHCVQRFDFERHETYFVKDLKKLKRQGFSLDRVLIVEDTPQKVQRNYGNAIYVTPFFGDPGDDELLRLSCLPGGAVFRAECPQHREAWLEASPLGRPTVGTPTQDGAMRTRLCADAPPPIHLLGTVLFSQVPCHGQRRVLCTETLAVAEQVLRNCEPPLRKTCWRRERVVQRPSAVEQDSHRSGRRRRG